MLKLSLLVEIFLSLHECTKRSCNSLCMIWILLKSQIKRNAQYYKRITGLKQSNVSKSTAQISVQKGLFTLPMVWVLCVFENVPITFRLKALTIFIINKPFWSWNQSQKLKKSKIFGKICRFLHVLGKQKWKNQQNFPKILTFSTFYLPKIIN